MNGKTKTVFLALTALLVAALALPGPGRALDKDEILAKVQDHYSKSTGLTADYQRVTTTPAMEGVFESTSQHLASGVIHYMKPDKLSLDQKEPREELLVTNGKTVWWYIPGEKQVHQYSDVDVYGELKPLLDFLGGMGGLEKHYYVKVIPAGTKNNKNHRLDLNRLTEGDGPQDITVWVDPKSYNIEGFKLISLTGETTVFNLSNVKTDPKLDDAEFNFKVPDGVKIVEETDEM